jgi:hypothetical protein
MNASRIAVLGACATLLLVGAIGASAADTPPRLSPAQFLGITPGMLVTPDLTLRARMSSETPTTSAGVAFGFRPSGSDRLIPIGVDRTAAEPAFGPDCDERACVKNDEFSVAIGDVLDRLPEGRGSLAVFPTGQPERATLTDVYWDSTPPRAEFRTPRFAAQVQKNGLEVVAQSKDENLVSVNVKWILVPVGTRPIPQFEQHQNGSALTPGGHASCVPTAAAANFQWLQDTSQWNVYPSDICGPANPSCFVGVLGLLMHTGVNGGGTSGGDFEQGILDFLDLEFGYQRDVDYTMTHESTSGGFSPEKLVEEFAAGGVVNVGLHNLPMDPGFGHVVALANATLNANGTAKITLMDENQEPNGPTPGQFRTFTLAQDGTIGWSKAYTTYLDPPSGKVAVDELLSIRDFSFFNFASRTPSSARRVGGVVPGKLEGNGHTWVGRFEPPRGLTGPFLLITESKDASGHTQRDYQYVGEAPSRG